MNRLLFVSAFLFIAFAGVAQRNGKDYAVFFVASKFDNGWTDLPDAAVEVSAIATQLRDLYDFDIKIVTDATRGKIVQTLGEYKQKQYGVQDQLLLFFSMHGIHDLGSDKGYLIPKDGLYDDPTYDSWFSHSQLSEIASSMPCKRILVSLDACYSGIFGHGRTRPDAPIWEANTNDCQTKIRLAFSDGISRKYLTAGGDTRVPAKSIFAAQWLIALKNGGGEDGLLSYTELLAKLDQFKDPRPTWGNFVSGTDGDFVFVKKNGCLQIKDRDADGIADAEDKCLYNIKVAEADKVSEEPIKDAEVQLVNYKGNNIIEFDEKGNLFSVQTIDDKEDIGSVTLDKGLNGKTDSKGCFAANVKPGIYNVIIKKKDYKPKQFRLSISKPGDELAIQLKRLSMDVSGQVLWTPSIFNYNTNSPFAAGTMVFLTDTKTGKTDTLLTDAEGTIDHYLNNKSKYRLDILQGGRIIGSTEVNTYGWPDVNKPMCQNISVAPLMPGTVVELPNVYYNYNDATLRPDGCKEADLVVLLMKQQPSIKIEIRSHTDCRGNDEYNQLLTQRRANGIMEYMVTQGIARNRLVPVGYGESEPRNICINGVDCTEGEYARNRRTEIRLLAVSPDSSMLYLDGNIKSQKIDGNKSPQP